MGIPYYILGRHDLDPEWDRLRLIIVYDETQHHYSSKVTR